MQTYMLRQLLLNYISAPSPHNYSLAPFQVIASMNMSENRAEIQTENSILNVMEPDLMEDFYLEDYFQDIKYGWEPEPLAY